jgi:hypothetical protein
MSASTGTFGPTRQPAAAFTSSSVTVDRQFSSRRRKALRFHEGKDEPRQHRFREPDMRLDQPTQVTVREIQHAETTARAWDSALANVDREGEDPLAALVSAIREGRHDADPALYDALLKTTQVAAEVWKPTPSKT